MHSWDDFRYFHAVATYGSFSVAARKLGVNHSTVSRRIQVLEQRHGVRLLERTRSGYAMTEAGAAVFETIEQAQASIQKASRVMLGHDARLEGRINLTMPHDLFDSCMAAPLKQFCDSNPAIELSLAVTPGLRDLANREADIAVRLTPSPPDYLVGKCITPMQHGIYARRDLQWPGEAPIVVWWGDKTMPGWALEHFENPRIALRVDDLASMHMAVSCGYGIARMPCFFPDALQHEEVVRLPVPQRRSDWGIWLLNHVDLRNTARINHCKDFLDQALTELIPLIQGELSSWQSS